MVKNLALSVLLLLALLFHLYKLDIGFNFNHDQQITALASYDFFKFQKISLIGQELSFQGFFLGPLHSWISFIPYGLCNLKPDCVPYFFAAIGLFTALILYLVSKKIFGAKTSLIVTFIYTFSFVTLDWERGASSNYFLFLSSLGLLYCLYNYFWGKNKYLLIGSFLAGVAAVNFNPVFIFSSLAFLLTSLLRSGRSPKIYLLSFALYLSNYLPLVIFNFRHNNLLLNSILKFAEQNVGEIDYAFKVAALARTLIYFISNYLFQSANILFVIFTLALLAIAVRKIFKSQSRFLSYFPIWILIVFLGFIFYRGHIPDYYFIQIILPSIVLIAFALRKNFLLFLIFVVSFAFTNINRLHSYENSTGYKVKKEAINYVIKDTAENSFNVYFDMPPGANTGYAYLFKAHDREPVEGGKNLYILELVDPWRFNLAKYKRSFPDKTLNTKTFSFLHVISIK